MSDLRVAVIGAGVAGSAAAYALGRRGARVYVFEKYNDGHDHGASHGESRLIRLAYYEHPDYVPLLRCAYADWHGLEIDCGEALFRRTGLVEAGPAESGLITGLEHAAAAFDLPLRTIKPGDAAAQCAGLNLPADWRAVLEENAGYLLADRALAAFRKRAAAQGAQFHWNDAAVGLDVSNDCLVLSTQNDRVEVDRLIITPGPWSNKTLAALGLAPPCSVRAIAKLSCWFTLRNGAACDTPFAVEDDNGAFFYAIPAPQGGAFKVGAHYGGPCLDDPDAERPPLTSEAASITEFVRRFVTGAAPEIIRRTECLYEKSPDEHFVIDRAAEDPRIAYAIGLSGHGFKFAPVIGELLADLVTGAATSNDAAFISAARFRKN